MDDGKVKRKGWECWTLGGHYFISDYHCKNINFTLISAITQTFSAVRSSSRKKYKWPCELRPHHVSVSSGLTAALFSGFHPLMSWFLAFHSLLTL
ncbi:hypothetical protein IMY05_008G0017800 [Salix suchowensis]|nr:hypothetical protein IMY05_008G0017800 [Salix suchowensis]